MFISARDLARFGLFTLRRGRWNGEQLLSDEWFAMALTRTGANPGYGFMNFFLNTGRRAVPSAPESAFYHLGSGANVVYVDPEHDLVIVARWIQGQALATFAQYVLEAVID
jgi:CubicO group peptidase (beta-lactamase class C family)